MFNLVSLNIRNCRPLSLVCLDGQRCGGRVVSLQWRSGRKHLASLSRHTKTWPCRTSKNPSRPFSLPTCTPGLTWSGDLLLYKEGFSPLGPTYILPHLLIVGLTLPSTATALYETKTQSPAKEEIISGVTKMLVMPLLAVIHRPVDQFLSKPFV